MCFTDLSPAAMWRGRQHKPWTVDPNYGNLFGFELWMVVPDLLHCWNLGTLRDVVACVLKCIIKEPFVFAAGSDIDSRFQLATESLRRFARAHGHCLRLKKLSRSKIAWKSRTYPEFKGSGSDCHVVAAWLEVTLQPFQDRYGDFCTLLWSGNKCMRVLYSADFFLTDGEKRTVETLGHLFLSTYMRMASSAIQNNELLFRARPKCHLMSHLFDSQLSRRVNPAMYATWLDEDWLKKIARTMRLTNVKTSQARVLERWLMAVPENLQRMIRTWKNISFHAAWEEQVGKRWFPFQSCCLPPLCFFFFL